MRSSLTHFLVALAVFIATVCLYATWYAAVSGKSYAVADLQSRIATAGENAGRMALARAALSEIAGDETNMQNYFVSESSAVSFINELEALGLAQKATVTVLSVSKGTVRLSLQLTLSIKGSFDAVMRTVGAIEYVPYAVSIMTLSVGQDAKNSWHADLTLVADSASIATSTVSTPVP